ncbi:hypothetical protein HYZ99_02980 [Candidatus Peregrinibacteria bacterium]|nr:hypothetical protein [Candidatus Peregrinibacteria bacterium]
MSISPQAPPAGAAPVIPTGQELFDVIMGQIEPELTTEGVKTLDQKYQNETAEGLMERKKRYDLAFERYDQAYEGYVGTLQAQMQRYRKHSFNQAEMEDRQSEGNFLDRIHTAMFKAA